jgi:hypothetical protein
MRCVYCEGPPPCTNNCTTVICYVPPGHPELAQTILINTTELQQYLSEGSYEGNCTGAKQGIFLQFKYLKLDKLIIMIDGDFDSVLRRSSILWIPGTTIPSNVLLIILSSQSFL